MGVETMSGPDIAAIIRDRALAYGVDPDVLIAMARAESGLDPTSANPSSSAKGLFQFVDKTWRDYGNGADPLDPYASADAGARYARDNAKLFKASGIEPTGGTLYLGHFLGPRGAVTALRASDDQPAAAVLDPATIKANPFLASMSIGDVKAWAGRKAGGGAVPAGGGAAHGTAPTMMAQAGGAAHGDAISGDAGGIGDMYGQIAKVAQMLATPAEPLPVPAPLQLPDPAAAARARILRAALAGTSGVRA